MGPWVHLVTHIGALSAASLTNMQGSSLVNIQGTELPVDNPTPDASATPLRGPPSNLRAPRPTAYRYGRT